MHESSNEHWYECPCIRSCHRCGTVLFRQYNPGGIFMVRKSARTLPEWSRKILGFRQALKLTQGELGRRLRTSAMAVSRRERGRAEPLADACIRLGNIADDPLCWFF
jgi:DNA-binding XRE family transcriptional regulator